MRERLAAMVPGTLPVRHGKGRKDRMVPIGERALRWVETYLREVRPGLVVPPDQGVIFLSHLGEPIAPGRLTEIVRDYVNAAAVGKKGSYHLFRHAMATLMLEGGADIRFIQQMLGHAELSTTQLYTQVSIKKLQDIHRATHLAAAGGAMPLSKVAGEEEGGAALLAADDD
jgi:integrase/recombinase XerD